MSDTTRVDCRLYPFAYRRNLDGSVDSICLRCYLTAATARNDADLHERETAHQCPDLRSKSKKKPLG
jgi:hypothetical protein